MAKLVILLFCLAAIHCSMALKCYTCVGQCDKQTEETCDNVTGKKAACLKEVYKIDGKTNVDKKCVYYPEDKEKYECAPLPSGQERVSCDPCEKDLCNSAPSHSLNILAAAGILLALVIPKFL